MQARGSHELLHRERIDVDAVRDVIGDADTHGQQSTQTEKKQSQRQRREQNNPLATQDDQGHQAQG